MYLYLKYVIKNLKKNIYQPFMIVFIITLSCTVFFASLNFLNVFNQYYSTRDHYKYGDSDISITIGSSSKTRFMQKKYLEEIIDTDDKIYGMYVFSSLYNYEGNNYLINTIGMEFNSANSLSKINFIEQTKRVEISINKIAIISKRFSNKFNIGLGDEFTIKMADKHETYVVYGISENNGIFYEKDILLNDEGVINLFLDSMGLSIIKGTLIYNQFQIKTSNQEELHEKIKSSEYFKDKEISLKVNNYSDLGKSNEKIILIVISIVTIVLCVVFIYSVLLLLINKRLKIIHLFKAVGARSYQLTLYLLAEIGLYTLIGICLSFVFGKTSSNIIIKEFIVNGIELEILPNYYIYTFVFGVVIAFISSISEVIKTTRKPLNLIIKESNKQYKMPNKGLIITILVVFLTSFITVKFIKVRFLNIFGFVLLFTTLILIYYFTSLLIIFVYKLIKRTKNKNLYLIGILSSKQKANHNANKMFVLSFTILMSIFSATNIIKDNYKKVENMINDGIHIFNINDPKNTLINEVSLIDGVDNSYPYLQSKASINNGKIEFNVIATKSENIDKIINTKNIKIVHKKDFKMNSIILPLGIIEKEFIKYGDLIEVAIDGMFYQLEVSGYIDSPIMFTVMNLDGLNKSYNSMFVESENKDLVYQELSQKFSFKSFYLLYINDIFNIERTVVLSIIKMLEIFSLIIIFVLFIGVINSFIMSSIYEIDNFQIHKRIGYPNSLMFKNTLLEYSINGLIFSFIMIIGSYFLNESFKGILKISGFYSNYKIDYKLFIVFILASFLLYLLTSIIKYITFSKTKINKHYE